MTCCQAVATDTVRDEIVWRVLVVEDDEAIALVIQDLLESEGFEVRRARNGRRADPPPQL